jgi:hypothetical protein
MSLFLTGDEFDATPIYVGKLKAELLSKNTCEQNL